jgi:hypothetical protein
MPEHTVSETRGRNRFGHNSKTSTRGHKRYGSKHRKHLSSSKKCGWGPSGVYFRLVTKEDALDDISKFNKYGENYVDFKLIEIK